MTEAGTERRQALDGKFLDLTEFQNWYPSCWQRNWQNAVSRDENVDPSAAFQAFSDACDAYERARAAAAAAARDGGLEYC